MKHTVSKSPYNVLVLCFRQRLKYFKHQTFVKRKTTFIPLIKITKGICTKVKTTNFNVHGPLCGRS